MQTQHRDTDGGGWRDATSWTVGVLTALAVGTTVAAYAHQWLVAVIVGACVLACYPGWLGFARFRRARAERREAAAGLTEIEEWLANQPPGGKVTPGGVAEKCPICGKPSSPWTGRCMRHF